MKPNKEALQKYKEARVTFAPVSKDNCYMSEDGSSFTITQAGYYNIGEVIEFLEKGDVVKKKPVKVK